MGGENEKVLKSKPVEETPKTGGAQTLKSTSQTNIRLHEDRKTGNIHFHDDSRKLKVAVPTAAYFKRFEDWKTSPDSPLTFVDADNKAEVVLTAKRVMKNP